LGGEKPDPHVVSNVATQDILAVGFSIQTLVLFAETCKPLLTMWNVQTSIQSALYQSRDESATKQADTLSSYFHQTKEPKERHAINAASASTIIDTY